MENIRQEAVPTLEEMAVRDPSSAIYLPLAEKLRAEGRVEEAIRLCEERRTRPGRGVGDHIVLGRAYLADGRIDSARGEFAAALALDRENVVALKALAGILSHLGDHREAAAHYRAVCRVDPGDLESQTALHQITSGEYPEARPADIIVDQGELAWHPVRLPREEEHLGELSLGLKTIDAFDLPSAPVAPAPAAAYEEIAAPEPAWAREPAPSAASIAPSAPAPVEPSAPVEAAFETVSAGAPERESQESQPDPGRPQIVERRGPLPVPAPKPGAIVEGNKSAFQMWLEQLGGGRS